MVDILLPHRLSRRLRAKSCTLYIVVFLTIICTERRRAQVLASNELGRCGDEPVGTATMPPALGGPEPEVEEQSLPDDDDYDTLANAAVPTEMADTLRAPNGRLWRTGNLPYEQSVYYQQ